MKVVIKSLRVDMEVKNRGVEFEVRSPGGERQIGDLYLSKAGLTWCRGKCTRAKGKPVSWEEFIRYMENR